MKKILVVMILISLFSCDRKDLNKDNLIENNIESDKVSLNTLIEWDTLFIASQFDECGEWGGHKEVLEIFKKDEKVYLNYKRNTIDCNKNDAIYNTKLSLVKKITINNEQQEGIKNYIFKLLQGKIDEGPYGHSGKKFKVSNSDSTLLINVYDNNDINLINYKNLLEQLEI